MKKFTFLFSLLIMGIMVSGQPNKTLSLRIQKIQEKYSRIAQQTDLLKRHQMNNSHQDVFLKSAAATITLDSVVYRNYDTGTTTWVNESKDEYIYNTQLKNTEWLEKSWNVTLNTWEDEGRIVLEYDTEGRISEMMIYSANETGGELVEDTRLKIFYNSEGVLDSILHYYAETEGNWEIEVRQIYYYNNAGQLTRMDMTSLEEDEGDEFLQVLRFDYTYDNAGRMLKSSMYFIDEDFEMLFSETEYFFDGQGRRTASEFSMLNFMNFETDLVSRTEYEYNALNDVIEDIVSVWDDTTEEWDPDQRNVYSYRNINFSDVIFPSYINLFGFNEAYDEYNKPLSEINSFEMQEGNWVPTDKTNFYYSDETYTSVPQNRLVQLMVYPNPASDHIFVKWDGTHQLSMEVYQVTGAKAMEMLIYPGQEISISHLQKGIYIYKVLNNRQTLLSGKLIKK
jgi:hypothetical protein